MFDAPCSPNHVLIAQKKVPGTARSSPFSGTVMDSGPLNEMPPDGCLLAEEPGAGGAPPDGANLEHLANKDQVNTEDGNTLHKVAS